MPWTRKQVKLLLSDASPLTSGQKDKMKSELHANPKMGHLKKGSKQLKKRFSTESHAYNFKQHRGGRQPKRG